MKAPGGAVIYTRVSTEEQGRSGLGLEAQEAACREWAARAGREVVAVYRDTQSGGAPLDRRTMLLDALSAVPRGGVLVAARRDRIARDVGITAAITAAVAKRRATMQTLDVQTEDEFAARVQMLALDLVAEVERMLGKARTKAAAARLRARGRYAGGAPPYGWRVAEDGSLERDPIEGEVVDWIRSTYRTRKGLDWWAPRWTLAELVEDLNRRKVPCRGGRWHLTTVARLVKRAKAETS